MRAFVLSESMRWLRRAVIAAALLGGCTNRPEPLQPGRRSQPPSTAATTGLLAAYGFGEGAGTTTADASGAGITGTLNGAAWASGKNGSGLSFNGTSSYVSLGNPAALAVTGSISVSAWVNESGNVSDDGIIIARSNGAGGWELKSSPDTGARTFAFGVYDPTGAYVARYSRTVRALGTWYHVAGVYDAAAQALHVYVNGVLDDGALWNTVPASISAPSLSTNIGTRSASFNIKGILDDVRVYGRALSQAEIQADMNVAVGGGSGDAAAPSSPGGLSATAVSSSRIDLAWAASTDNVAVTGYRILRNGSAIATSALTSYSDVTASASTTYSYAVSAFDAAGNESLPSAPVSATTPAATGGDSTPPVVSLSAPTNGATVAGTAVVVGANASDNVRVAGVQFLLDGVNLGAEDTTSPWSITWNTTTAAAGTHVLSARARDAAGNLGDAANVTVVVDNQPPDGSVLINGGAAATRSTAATLTLSASDALGAVTQMRFSNTGTSFSPAEAYATTKAWTLSSGAGTKSVYVQFKDAAGNWSGSFNDSIVLDTTAPVISGVSPSNITGDAATISWTTDEPATSQVEYGRTTSYGSLTPIDVNLVTTHRITLSGLAARRTYSYRVRSKDGAGNERVGSNGTFTTAAVVDTSPPTVPAGVTARALSSSQIALSWIASTDNVGVAGYKIFRSGTQIASTTAASFTDSNLAPDTTCVYTVSAYDGANNNSAQSAPASATTLPDTTPPSVPANLAVAPASSSRIDLSWSASSDNVAVSGYAVFRDGAQIANVSGPAYSDAGLAPSATHAYAVAAFDPAGNVSARSAEVSATTLPVISVNPGVSTIAVGSTQAFTCTVSLEGQDGSCTWSIVEGPAGGSIAATGPNSALYSAPATTGTFHVIASSNADSSTSSGTVTVVNSATPTLVQHTASSSNEQNGLTGNDYKFTLPNPVLSGNCLILGVTFGANTYSGSTAVSAITDSSGDTWSTAPAVTSTDRATSTTAVFVHPNSTAGVHTITVTLTGIVTLFQYTISEFYNLDASAPVNGAIGRAAAVSGGAIATGSFTPGNSDASGGNLIWAYFANDSTPFSTVPANYAPATGFTLLDASIGTNPAQLPHGSMYFVQSTAGSINPSMNLTGGGTDTWTGVALALKAAPAGTAPSGGIRIRSLIHETNSAPPATWTVQFPSAGNLLVLRVNADPNLRSITDTNSNTWVKDVGGAGSVEPQIWHAANPTPGLALRVTLHFSGTPANRTILLYDVTGAATSSPVDSTQDNTDALCPITSSSYDLNNQPTITPASAGGLTIAALGMGIGPVDGFSPGAPTGAIYDFVYHTGDVDSDRMDSGDGAAHLFNPDTSVEHWNYRIPNVGAVSSGSICGGSAAHFRGAGAGAILVPTASPDVRRSELEN